ncbi:hypothetical protein AA101099_0089 [Neoasaia chiangmaiensis NBRC 101099]|uniref:Uncharacterized protein n=1 Tax=Neoasaia chiangmaiensis TaxID=320497 RepID=A0A1U9KLR9_9PROT|nr:type VI secretion system-associated protein TagF [Neoasaia chiangmaiensis]AQS86741.1 hypothetical protein A0U93_00870 [Neoasaia chiangmaiensis]GBR35606.1 hypothetical protein AA101099_0089 [Neoasaia chiangmaiensis NBRC 101099]GEN16408.1 hypothetical protein NCH01_28390 [Neoasaia chiangmaiensis]
MLEPFAGYWGKLPAHGDFLKAGFPQEVVTRLDRWIDTQLGDAEHRHGARFNGIWHAAPSWCFVVRPGVLDPLHAVTGIWTPSIDSVGRCFPFLFAILHDPAMAAFRALPSYDTVIRQAIERTQTIGVLEEALIATGQAPWPPAAPVFDVWWCVNHAGGGTLHGALPVGAAFDWLLDGTPPTGT